ncbi:hypothetical protein Taro_030489 [Colocasia esculenta]|uniref:Uncharacterized protein n=1 Tax=Colocasia esculenta TaxID=4460 RepID=A0A843VWA0_COLES|nr:hypothetical protein [Colocasia esculenta]
MAIPVFNLVLKKFDELLSQEVKLLLGVKPQLRSLHTQLSFINSFLREFDSNKIPKTGLVKDWVGKLRDVAYKAEDIIDAFFLEINQEPHVGWVGALTSCVICVGEIPARHDLGTQIEDVKNEIVEIFYQKSNFEIEIKCILEDASSFANEGPSELDKSAISGGLGVVGFVESEKRMVDQLLHGEGKRKVISVVGMGGLGKTTIAKKIYSRVDVEMRFKRKVWITVSRHYTVDEILRGILKGILHYIPSARHDKQQITDMNNEELRENVRSRLKNMRYLVVVDDIWDRSAWDYINAALPVDAQGSRVLLTTRIMDVADYAQGMTHQLSFLTEKESWELFCMKVFPNADCPSELKEVGTEMVNRCRGLPLAIVVLGGLLIGKPAVRYIWRTICDRLTHELSTERNEMIKDILALSYNDLPSDLKLCFLYIGLFPEDVEVDATKLTHMWVAEGFIEQEDGCTMEETAGKHLEQLARRSILQVVETDAMGYVSKCRIHDLLLDLANTEGEQNHFLDVHGHVTTNHEVKSRRLAIHGHNVGNCTSSECLTPKLHSLLCFNLHGQEMGDIFCGLKLIRVVDIEGAPVEMLPKEIGTMVHLKYLGLRRTKLSTLPAAIRNLHKLETLDIMDIRGISLPDAVWNMKTIRHIHASSVRPHASCGDLKNMQTLHTATADGWIQMSLGRLINLRKLGIEGILSSHVKALAAAILRLNHLNFLKLEGRSIPNVLGLALARHEGLHYLHLKGEMHKVSELQPDNLPPNLTQITLDGSRLEQDPLPLLERLSYLSTLILFPNSFIGGEMGCSADGFPRLQELYLHSLTGLRHVTMGYGAMRCLESLTIKNSMFLEELPDALENVGTLKELTLENMSPGFIEKVEEGGRDWHKVQNIPIINVS